MWNISHQKLQAYTGVTYYLDLDKDKNRAFFLENILQQFSCETIRERSLSRIDESG